MRIMKYVIVLLLILMAVALYVRLAPSDPARWHVDPRAVDAPDAGGYRIELSLPLPPEDALEAFERIALATARTHLLAGSPQDGRITFVTRSRLWGFPDYTTVAAMPAPGGSQLVVLARLRFGGGDMGVNRDRITLWLEELGDGRQ